MITGETNALICSWNQFHVIKAGNIGQTAREKTDGVNLAATRREFATPSDLKLESIVLSETSQAVRDKYHLISPLTGT